MLGLHQFRYACVWAKKIKSKNVIFNPQYQKHWDDAVSYWNHASSFNGNKQSIDELFSHLVLAKKSTKIESNKNQSFLSILPKKEIFSDKEFAKFIKDKTLLFTEKFGHPDSVYHLGSSRHLILGKVQVKGCGRNTLASRMDYSHAWGGMAKIEAYYSYLTSNYLNHQLPLGASTTFKVDEIKKGVFQALRVGDGIRLGQFTSHLNLKEWNFLRNELSKDGLLSPQEIFAQSTFQFAVANFLNIYNYSLIPENVLLDGRVIDCESIYTPNKLVHYNLYLDLCLKGPRKVKLKREKLTDWNYVSSLFHGQKNQWLCNSSVHGPIAILKKLSMAYSQIFQTKVGLEIDLFWKYLDQLAKITTGIPFDKNLVNFMQDFSNRPCEIGSSDKDNLTFDWNQALKDIRPLLDDKKPYEVFFISEEKHQTFLRVRFNLNSGKLINPLLNQYNSIPRMDLLREAAIAIANDKGVPALKNTSALNHEINRTLFAFPVVLVDGKIEFKTISKSELKEWIKESVGLEAKKVKCHFAYLDVSKKLTFAEGPSSLCEEWPESILYELEDLKTGFKYLSRTILIK